MSIDRLIKENEHYNTEACSWSPDTAAKHMVKNTKALKTIKENLEKIEKRIVANGDYAIVDIYFIVTETLKGDL